MLAVIWLPLRIQWSWNYSTQNFYPFEYTWEISTPLRDIELVYDQRCYQKDAMSSESNITGQFQSETQKKEGKKIQQQSNRNKVSRYTKQGLFFDNGEFKEALYHQPSCLALWSLGWPWITVLSHLDSKRSIWGNFSPWLVPWIKSSGSSCLQAAIWDHLRFRKLRQWFRQCWFE